jgi:hypothetical protein
MRMRGWCACGRWAPRTFSYGGVAVGAWDLTSLLSSRRIASLVVLNALCLDSDPILLSQSHLYRLSHRDGAPIWRFGSRALKRIWRCSALRLAVCSSNGKHVPHRTSGDHGQIPRTS